MWFMGYWNSIVWHTPNGCYVVRGTLRITFSRAAGNALNKLLHEMECMDTALWHGFIQHRNEDRKDKTPLFTVGNYASPNKRRYYLPRWKWISSEIIIFSVAERIMFHLCSHNASLLRFYSRNYQAIAKAYVAIVPQQERTYALTLHGNRTLCNPRNHSRTHKPHKLLPSSVQTPESTIGPTEERWSFRFRSQVVAPD